MPARGGAGHTSRSIPPRRPGAARRALETLREGFEAVRPEALRLEREGAIPPLERTHCVEATA